MKDIINLKILQKISSCVGYSFDIIVDHTIVIRSIGLLPDTQNCGLRMCRECRERFPRHRLQRKPLVSDPGMHHGTCVTHVPWCMSGSLTRGGGEHVPGIPGACASRNFAYLVRSPCTETCTDLDRCPENCKLFLNSIYHIPRYVIKWKVGSC